MISQLTIFLQNKEGRLASACRTIGDANVNMHSLFVADTKDFGVARIICDKPSLACEKLLDAGFRASVVQVVAVRLGDKPGSLADMLELLDANGINIEYGYCFDANGECAVDVLKISEEASSIAERVLKDGGYEVLTSADLHVEA